MPLQTSGAISINDIATEFGGTAPHSLSEYYAGGGLVPAGTSGTNGAVPSSGQISLWNFYGTTKAITAHSYFTPGTYTFTVPAGVTYISAIMVGGGGGGGTGGAPIGTIGPASSAGGGGGGGGLMWVNNLQVNPGDTFTVFVGSGGSDFYEQNAGASGLSWSNAYSWGSVYAAGGSNGAGPSRDTTGYLDIRGYTGGNGGTFNPNYSLVNSGGSHGGGYGGRGGNGNSFQADLMVGGGGGGGAGGYTLDQFPTFPSAGWGGNGQNTVTPTGTTGQNGAEGGGGGGGGGYCVNPSSNYWGASVAAHGGAGGGVQIYGKFNSGLGGTPEAGGSQGLGGRGSIDPSHTELADIFPFGGFGAGGGGQAKFYGSYATGNSGVVRIIFGSGRAFPSTNVGRNYQGGELFF